MRLGSIEAGQALGPLQLIAQVAVKVSQAPRVQAHDGHLPKIGPPWEAAAQHKYCWEKCADEVKTTGGGVLAKEHGTEGCCQPTLWVLEDLLDDRDPFAAEALTLA